MPPRKHFSLLRSPLPSRPKSTEANKNCPRPDWMPHLDLDPSRLRSTPPRKDGHGGNCNYPGGLEGSDGAQALIVLSTVPKGLAPAVSRAVATAVRTAASPLADHRAR